MSRCRTPGTLKEMSTSYNTILSSTIAPETVERQDNIGLWINVFYFNDGQIAMMTVSDVRLHLLDFHLGVQSRILLKNKI